MSDMPTAEEVLEAWTKEVRDLYVVGRDEADGENNQTKTRAEFETWLAEVKAGVWDEGAKAQADTYGMDVDTGPNPYREEQS